MFKLILSALILFTATSFAQTTPQQFNPYIIRGYDIITNFMEKNYINTNRTSYFRNAANLTNLQVLGAVTNIYDLNLVDAVSPSEGQVLKYSNGVWTNTADSDVDTGFTSVAVEGAGNVVTNITFGGTVVTQQLGNITSFSPGITVTQFFLDASSTIRTNIFINGVLTTGYTE